MLCTGGAKNRHRNIIVTGAIEKVKYGFSN
jgi:hypothetical protein